MQAICVHEYGESDVLKLETIAQPEPQPNKVLIRVQAAGVNPLDWKIRAVTHQSCKSLAARHP